MKLLEELSDLAGRYMAIIVLVIASIVLVQANYLA